MSKKKDEKKVYKKPLSFWDWLDVKLKEWVIR
jgi:hypothetical protein